MNLSGTLKKKHAEKMESEDDDDTCSMHGKACGPAEVPPAQVPPDADVLPDAEEATVVPPSKVNLGAAELLERLNAARCGATQHVDINIGSKENDKNDENATGVPSKKRAASFPDSSDDEEPAGRNDERLAKKAKRAQQPAAAKPKPADTTSPTEGKIALGEVGKQSMLATQAPITPELMPENAPGRYVLVPASEFQCNTSEIAGWVAKIVKVDKTKRALTTIQFKDKKAEYFEFQYVKENFKPLTQPVTTSSTTKPVSKTAK